LNETLKTIYSLRTDRVFSDREVSDEDLETILDACVRAATGSFRQSYSIIVVRDRKVIKEYLQYEGSKALIFCVDFNRILDTAKYLGHTYEVEGIRAFITGSTDAILAAQTAAIAAKSLGIDVFFTNSVTRGPRGWGDMDRIYRKFELPEKYCFPLIALILGYSAEKRKYRKGRLKKGVIYYDKYHRLTNEELEEIVKEYDNPENHLWLDAYEKSRKDFKHYLDWFYTVWSARDKRSLPEKMKLYYQIFKRTGFLEGMEDPQENDR